MSVWPHTCDIDIATFSLCKNKSYLFVTLSDLIIVLIAVIIETILGKRRDSS